MRVLLGAALFIGFTEMSGTAAVLPTSSPAARQAVAEASGALLKGDGAAALKRLNDTQASEFTGAEQAFRTCVLERLNGADPSANSIDDPFVQQLLAAYRLYWRTALLDPNIRPAAEAALLHALRRLLGRDDVVDLDSIEPLLTDRLKQAGYHVLLGYVGPLRELMLWARQEQRKYRVSLPEGTHLTQVVLLDGFLSLGWSEYATCGQRGNGGWAKADALYAVVPRYKSIDGEEFRASFLGHETQHFADYKQFPDLQPWELEYRAKLTEIAQAADTQSKVLNKLRQSQGDDPAWPHPYANKRVLEALRLRLGLANSDALERIAVSSMQKAAIAELRADSERRRR